MLLDAIDETDVLNSEQFKMNGAAMSEKKQPLEKVLFGLAGTMTLLSALLSATVSTWFLILTAFVGVNQWLFVAFGNCPASMVLRRFGFRSNVAC